jgi:hypothetical protein
MAKHEKREQKVAKAQKSAVRDEAPIVVPRKSLFDQVAGYLDANDWRYSGDKDKQFFSMGCRIKDSTVRVGMDIFESDDWRRVMTVVTYPVFVPENRRPAVLESLNRINYTTIYGNFEMDMNDGEVRVRTVTEGELEIADSMLERVLHAAMGLADKNFAAIIAVAFGQEAPAKVIELTQDTAAGATLQ